MAALRFSRLLLSLGAAATLGALAAIVWGGLWMYDGWPAPPPLVRLFLTADGEHAYDLVEIDMCLAITICLWAPLWLALRRPRTILLWTVGGITAAFFLVPGVLILGEAVYIGLLAGDQPVSEYRFGSEAMVGHGGWAYQSRLSYLISGLLWGLGLCSAAAGVLAACLHIRRETAV